MLVAVVGSVDDAMRGLYLDLSIYRPFKTVSKNNTLAQSCGTWTTKLFKATAMLFGRTDERIARRHGNGYPQ